MSRFLIPVHDLMHRSGTMREIETDIVLDADLGAGLAKVPKGGSVNLSLRLESVHEGIYVSGTLRTKAQADCARCLDALQIGIEVDIQELFAYSLQVEDDLIVKDEQIDLEQVIVDSVVLNLPFTPICSKDCLGLCPECGLKINENPDHAHAAKIDSRWSELEKFAKESED
ncbi:MAG: YceD family protein [Rhodoluna sp.]